MRRSFRLARSAENERCNLRPDQARVLDRNEIPLVSQTLAYVLSSSFCRYPGDVPWNEDEAAKAWYARVKSRPSFRSLLTESMPGIQASKTYADLDF